MGSSAFEPLIFGSGGSMFSMARVDVWLKPTVMLLLTRLHGPVNFVSHGFPLPLAVTAHVEQYDSIWYILPFARKSKHLDIQTTSVAPL
jgi:hypothetical protein